jgi:hypothetical protein
MSYELPLSRSLMAGFGALSTQNFQGASSSLTALSTRCGTLIDSESGYSLK